jgi:hypothetical protein
MWGLFMLFRKEGSAEWPAMLRAKMPTLRGREGDRLW